ncbi:MAG TPA: DUF5694 domain-containing protein [Gemmatimonadaceae bacterium]
MRSLINSRSTVLVVFLACGLAACATNKNVATIPSATSMSAADRPTGFPSQCAPGEVEVMLLGTFHFEGSATDAVSGAPVDMLGAEKQAQLEQLADRLAKWAPQQIAVEYPATTADTVTARYSRYVASGGQTRSSNEVVQVGYRLARKLGHSNVYPVDYRMNIGNDSISALLARRPDLQRLSDSLTTVLKAESAAREKAESIMSLTERLRQQNTDSALHAGNSWSMFHFLLAGEGNNRGGPKLLASWYERNIQIIHNLTRVLRPETRRVLMIMGSGHVPALRNILDESPMFCPVSPLPYLR